MPNVRLHRWYIPVLLGVIGGAIGWLSFPFIGNGGIEADTALCALSAFLSGVFARRIWDREWATPFHAPFLATALGGFIGGVLINPVEDLARVGFPFGVTPLHAVEVMVAGLLPGAVMSIIVFPFTMGTPFLRILESPPALLVWVAGMYAVSRIAARERGLVGKLPGCDG